VKLNTEILETHEAKLTVDVEAENFLSAKKRAAKQLSKKYKIPGFRPGKAPYAVVQKHLGDGAITEQAVGTLIDDLYPKAITEAEISPYGPGSLEEMESLDPPQFVFVVPLAPEVELADYSDLRIEFTPKEVEDESINEVIENLRDSQATIDNVDRPAEEGDMVYIVLSGTRKGEEDPEKKSLLEERRYPVIIEKKDAQPETEYPFPGFSRKLIGLSAGDKKKVQYTFKDDYEFEDLQGVTGIYKVSVEEIKGRQLPEVNDEFAKAVGEFDNVEKLKEEIRQTLTEQFKTEQQTEYESQIVDQLVSEATIKFPPQMLEDEIDDFINDLQHQLSQQGITIDIYLKSRSLEMEELREEVKENAEARMKRGLVLMEVANKEEIVVPPDEISERVQATLQEVSMYYSEEEAQRLGSGQNLQNLMNRIATDEIITRTLKKLRNIAMGITEEEEETTAEQKDSPAEEEIAEATDSDDGEAAEESIQTTSESEEAVEATREEEEEIN
jgi:trigger factor